MADDTPKPKKINPVPRIHKALDKLIEDGVLQEEGITPNQLRQRVAEIVKYTSEDGDTSLKAFKADIVAYLKKRVEEQDDEGDKPLFPQQQKKRKVSETSTTSTTKAPVFAPKIKKPKVDKEIISVAKSDDGEYKIKVYVRGGKQMIDLRRYNKDEKTGEQKGKTGLSMEVATWEKIMSHGKEIREAIKNKKPSPTSS